MCSEIGLPHGWAVWSQNKKKNIRDRMTGRLLFAVASQEFKGLKKVIRSSLEALLKDC